MRLGLSRASQSSRAESASPVGRGHYPAALAGGGWGTVSGGSVLAQQMIYGEPWLYGTVRAQLPQLGQLPQQRGAPVLLVCSCPDFLGGTARDLGSNCRKCGGHRLAGLAIGGTCRVPTTTVRARPSLAGATLSLLTILMIGPWQSLPALLNFVSSMRKRQTYFTFELLCLR